MLERAEAIGPFGSKPSAATAPGSAAHQLGMKFAPLAGLGLMLSESPGPGASPSQTLPLASVTSAPEKLILSGMSKGKETSTSVQLMSLQAGAPSAAMVSTR